MTFGIGIACWLILGSLIASRLMLFQLPPPGLLPTIVIEVAPPAVAGAAYFDLHGTKPDLLAYGLAGYAVLMVVAQLRFVPIYRRLRFVPVWTAQTTSSATGAAPVPPWAHSVPLKSS